jgi:hypothetical protein
MLDRSGGGQRYERVVDAAENPPNPLVLVMVRRSVPKSFLARALVLDFAALELDAGLKNRQAQLLFRGVPPETPGEKCLLFYTIVLWRISVNCRYICCTKC